MQQKALLVSLLFISATLMAGVIIHPANASVYNWTFSITKLSEYSHTGAALAYDSNLQKTFWAYGSQIDQGDCLLNPCSLDVVSSTDTTTWANNVDTGYGENGEALGITYNTDDQRLYIAFSTCGGCPTDFTTHDMYVTSSSDGTSGSWSSRASVDSYFENANNAYPNYGPSIVFDSTNHRLVISEATISTSCNCAQVFLYQSSGPNYSQNWSKISSNPVSVGGAAIAVWSAPALVFLNGKLYMAYVDLGNGLHVIQSTDGITWTNKVDFAGQAGYLVGLAFNPVEQSFHMLNVGVTSPFYLYDNTSPDGITWTGPIKLSGAMSANSLNAPSMTFVPNKNVLVLGYTGTDGSGTCPCHGGYLYAMSEVAPSDTAQFISQTPPPSLMTPGQQASVSITMKNTGTTTWLPTAMDPNAFRLGAQNPQDNSVWGFNRVQLTTQVSPGGQYTFQFTVTAPSTSGTYNFQWRMVQELVTWFGDSTPNLQVSVGTTSTRLSNDPTSSDWTVQRNSWNLVSGYLDGSGTSAEIASRNSFASDRTVTVSAKSVTPGSQVWYMPWIRGKWVDDCNTATLVFLNGATLGLQLNVAQGCTNHQWTVTTSLSPTAWHSVKMVFTGNEVKVYVDGTLYFDQTDAFIGNLGAARVALASWGPSESQFDSMTIS